MSERDIQGFYTAYLTGSLGSSLAIFTFFRGGIAGADLGGGVYNGSYKHDSKSDQVHCEVDFTLRVGQTSIGGVSATTAPISAKVPFVVPLPLDPDKVIRIDTLFGPINVRLEKLRDL